MYRCRLIRSEKTMSWLTMVGSMEGPEHWSNKSKLGLFSLTVASWWNEESRVIPTTTTSPMYSKAQWATQPYWTAYPTNPRVFPRTLRSISTCGDKNNIVLRLNANCNERVANCIKEMIPRYTKWYWYYRRWYDTSGLLNLLRYLWFTTRVFFSLGNFRF